MPRDPLFAGQAKFPPRKALEALFQRCSDRAIDPHAIGMQSLERPLTKARFNCRVGGCRLRNPAPNRALAETPDSRHG